MRPSFIACSLALLASLTTACGSSDSEGGSPEDGDTTPLSLQTFSGSEGGFYASSTLILGETDAVLVDAQFTLSDAGKLADMIEATGKDLRTVFITHAHPDHYFGVEVIQERFPEAEVLASPEVVDQMKALGPQKLAQWKPVYGDDLTSAPRVAEPFDGDHLELDGQRIDLVALEPGEIEHATVLHLPSTGAVIAGDMVYAGTHVWLADADAAHRQGWLRNLETIKALAPTAVVAGHKAPGNDDAPALLDTTAAYIRDFDEVVAESSTASDAEEEMLARYPDLKLPVMLEYSCAAAFPAP
ncbi:MBL fold metallo-hydrolase [Chondromyces apiculatus]|uniref:Metallo-beta-lactamase superfamily protein n=1 Tax=Chondromyces apiculatus DSM 436 TaxID=1192034 RepID=A0A017T6V3_9BACT|nr:MBL fold metallo-hydrolase [Chondromyces apiculatus]EYF04510.1 Metallo-beta-lactamase superfamily protein [Chondromyces apiculatus DSM 436]